MVRQSSHDARCCNDGKNDWNLWPPS
eukprot:CCRYP_003127-RA/>CCRYP_003127-RA protein AED:0.00 eAED:0.00 QI:80/1/1/1/0/0/2/37/25